MYYSFGMLAGVCVACMVFFNTLLSGEVGVCMGTLIFHFFAFIIISLYGYTQSRANATSKGLPFLYYMPGVAGVFTVLSSSVSVSSIGLTLTIALSLFGQLVFSSIVDHFGLLGMEKRPFQPKKLVGLSIIFSGVLAMIYL